MNRQRSGMRISACLPHYFQRKVLTKGVYRCKLSVSTIVNMKIYILTAIRYAAVQSREEVERMEKKSTVSEAELEIMEVLWQSDKPLSAYEIRQRLNETRQWERTTVLTLIRRLVEKGILVQDKKDIYYYSAGIARDDYLKEETRNFLNRFYKGKAKELIVNLFKADGLTKEDIKELQSYVDGDKKDSYR